MCSANGKQAARQRASERSSHTTVVGWKEEIFAAQPGAVISRVTTMMQMMVMSQ